MNMTLQQTPEEGDLNPFRKEEDLARRLCALRVQREEAQKRAVKVPRKALKHEERAAILAKTGGRCHICGGLIAEDSDWEADHILRRCVGGDNQSDNYLPAHGLCNTYRWDHLPEEVQWVLKIGVWARKRMEGNSDMGRKMLHLFFQNEKRRERRRRGNNLSN